MKNSSIHKALATIVTSALVANYSTQTLTAEAIDSQVIHNYSEISLGYSYLHDIANTDLNAHGVVGAASFEVKNFIFGLGGGYASGDKDFGVGLKTDLYTLTGGIGYAIRLAENRVNIIPNLALAYSKISASIPDLGSTKEDATVIQPGVTVSFAINNRWSINAGYLYSHDLDSNNDGGNSHALRLGTRVALAERVGLDIGAVFIEDYGFSGINAGVSFHF